MSYFAVVMVGYLLGSISFSFLAGKLFRGIDIRQYGSGNAGATNTLRVIGWPLGIAVLLADGLKGALSVWLGFVITGDAEGMALGGLAAVIGHNWSVYLKFRGGKGVATTIGVMYTVALIPSLIASAVGLILLAIFRMVSLSSLVFITVLPIILLFMQRSYAYVLLSLVFMTMVYARHRANIKRILNGTEHRLGSKR